MVGYLNPNADTATKEWDTVEPAGAAHYSVIDEISGDQANLDATDYIHTDAPPYGGSESDIFSMETLSDVDSVSGIKIWVNGYPTSSGKLVTGLNIGGTSKQDIITAGDPEGWYSVEWTGLSASQSDLDDLTVELEAVCQASVGGARVHAMYAEVTYTELAAAAAFPFDPIYRHLLGGV